MAQEWPIQRVQKSAQAWKTVGRRVALTLPINNLYLMTLVPTVRSCQDLPLTPVSTIPFRRNLPLILVPTIPFHRNRPLILVPTIPFHQDLLLLIHNISQDGPTLCLPPLPPFNIPPRLLQR